MSLVPQMTLVPQQLSPVCLTTFICPAALLTLTDRILVPKCIPRLSVGLG